MKQNTKSILITTLSLAVAIYIVPRPSRGADVPISGLPAATTISGADVVPIVQSGTTKKASFTVQKSLWDTYYQPLDADLTALAALGGTHTIYYRSAANTWTAVTIGSGLDFTGATLSVSGFAPSNAHYLTSQAESGLSAEVNLGALTTGLLKGTVSGSVSTISAITDSSSNWDTAFTDRLKWDGGATGLVAATGRTSLGLVIGTNVQAWDTQLDSLASLSYTGNTLKVVRVNAGETSFELATVGGGTVTHTGGALTSNAVVLGAGTDDVKVVAGIVTDGTAKLTLGVNITTLGQLKLFGNTSGDVTLQPAAVAGTSTLVLLPNSSSVLPIFGYQMTFTGPSAARTVTLPDANFTAARTDAANTFTGHQTIEGVTSTGATGTGKFVFDTAPQISTIELGAASDTTIARVGAGQISVEGVNVVTTSSTDTLTNKEVAPRSNSVTSATSWTPDFDSYDIEIQTALAGAVTINAPTYTGAREGESRMLRIKDNGTARAITWNAAHRAVGVTLPTTTVISKNLWIGEKRNVADSKWDVLAVGQE